VRMSEKYKKFHINRIISTLLDQQKPYNANGINGLSDVGNYIDTEKDKKARTILSSLYEIGIISSKQYYKMYEIVTGAKK